MKDNVPLHCMTRLGVIDAARQAQVQALLAQAAAARTVDIMPAWYF
ncbi:hypothetical protein APY03_2328 [Variovorax sp. WDL1]|nr:hypothetical protein APY03_2328 [Variovorax sp. WDL1]